ncbi:response regulator transcription factor [Chitinophaga flava]|uniref:DNA-binding response regulator n=1 Tax=Chitinophaga flava TaxID=2259036 RepID=A0A365XUY8_9BACT|nr:response regulator transcription factor [Chitinophaga flava]RBL90172.1 DNA-binding response regulator [Chitinophaga flava]
MSRIHIALIDDQKLFRQSLALLIKSIPGFELIMEAQDGRDFLLQLSAHTVLPEIALVDMEMPHMNGIELNDTLQQQYPAIKVIILSVHAKERLIARMIESGASGYLLKNCDQEELITAIHTTFSSGFYMSAQVLKAIQLASKEKNTLLRNVNNIPIELTKRETEVLQLICKEYNNTEIGETLFISARTVEGHRNNLLAKTGRRNTAGLVLFAVKFGIFDTGF